MYSNLRLSRLTNHIALGLFLNQQPKEAFEYFTPFKELTLDYLFNEMREPNLFWGVYLDETLKGFSMLRFHPDYKKPSFGYMVDIDFRNKGFGKLLFQHTLSFAKINGFEFVAKTDIHNLSSAHIFYNRFNPYIKGIDSTGLITYG